MEGGKRTNVRFVFGFVTFWYLLRVGLNRVPAVCSHGALLLSEDYRVQKVRHQGSFQVLLILSLMIASCCPAEGQLLHLFSCLSKPTRGQKSAQFIGTGFLLLLLHERTF